jgi:hypothetical protein
VASWVWAIAVSTLGFVRAVVPIEPLMPVSAIPTVLTAGDLSTASSVAVLLAAWVMSLYGWVLVDFL